MTPSLTTSALLLIHALDGATTQDLLGPLGVSAIRARRAALNLRRRGLVEAVGLIPTGRAPTMRLRPNEQRVLDLVLRRREDGAPTRRLEVQTALSMTESTARNVIATLRACLALHPADVLVLTPAGAALAASLAAEGPGQRGVLEVVVSFPGMTLSEVAAELHLPVGAAEQHVETLRRRLLVAPDVLEPVNTSPRRWPRLSGPSTVAMLSICRAWEAGGPLSAVGLGERLVWDADTVRYSLVELRRAGALKPGVLVPTSSGVRVANIAVPHRTAA